ncbi:MAG: hypothetical protein ACREQM_13520, partial [Candidatus Dormibacteraceae bacterium]
MFAALGHAAALGGYGLDLVAQWIADRDMEDAVELIQQRSPDAKVIAAQVARLPNLYQGTQDGIYLAIENLVAPMRDPDILWALGGDQRFDF